MRVAVIAFFLLFVTLANPLFLVGSGNVGESIPVLCEGQESVFVSAPGGSAVQHSLDTSFQAEFTPEGAGPYTVQCGNETKTIFVKAEGNGADAAEKMEAGNSFLFLAGAATIVLFFAIGAYLLARKFISGRTEFSKIVQGNSAVLHLRCGKKWSKIKISDPVSMGCGRPLELEVGTLASGKEWKFEYEIDEPEKALPASLLAECKGEKIMLLSSLRIEGKNAAPHTREGRLQAKRKLPKAK
ncbi:Uncharacterised protein [uncultured archaeon]|nr:Uncharacterised protein [uncultured archaeon]